MKKKFVLTLALVLMVAVSLTAAPLELSGNFKAGYDVKLKSGANSIAATAWDEVSFGAIKLTGDFWKVEVAKNPLTLGDKGNAMDATATVYLSKALAAQGMDMADLSLEMTIGNKGDLGGFSVYADTRDDMKKLKMASGFKGAYATSMTVGYGDLVHVMFGADPVSFIDQTAPVLAKNNAIVLSAKTMPVEGVSAAIAYTNVDADSTDGSFAGSVMVDVAKLAGLDFGLKLSAYDVFLFQNDVNRLYVELSGSYADFSAWTEYRIVDKVNGMKLKVAYTGIENLGLSAGLQLNDITKKASPVANEVIVGAGMEYHMGGVTYGLEGNYMIEDKSFTMTPTVKIVF